MKSRIGLFILIGLSLYIVDYRFSYDEDLNQIIIPDDEILGLIDTWRDQVGRDPSDEEIVRIINNLVNEEILYREALKLDLDKNDQINYLSNHFIFENIGVEKQIISSLLELVEVVEIENLKHSENCNIYQMEI